MTDESESFTFGINLMKEALESLSLSSEEQAAYLAKGGYGDCTDELALEFDDAYQVIKGYFGKKCFPTEAESLMDAIDVQLKSISGPDKSEFWTTAALRDKAEWKSIRGMAARAKAMVP